MIFARLLTLACPLLLALGSLFYKRTSAYEGEDICRTKQSVNNIMELAADFDRSFENEWTETGAVIIPNLKLVICGYPKASHTTTKWIILALLGYMPEEFCEVRDKTHMNHQQYHAKGIRYVRDERPPKAFKDEKDLKYDCKLGTLGAWNTLPRYFLDPSWTTVAIVSNYKLFSNRLSNIILLVVTRSLV